MDFFIQNAYAQGAQQAGFGSFLLPMLSCSVRSISC